MPRGSCGRSYSTGRKRRCWSRRGCGRRCGERWREAGRCHRGLVVLWLRHHRPRLSGVMTVFLRAFLARPALMAAISFSSLFLFAPATPLAGQDPQVRTLTQLGGFQVMVEDLDSAVQADGAVRFDSIEIGRAV